MKINVVFYMLILAAAAGISQAQYIFQDDFENVAPGVFNDPNSDADPAAAIGSWIVSEDPNSGAQVIDAPVPGANHDDQYLYLNRYATYAPSGTAGIYAVLSEPANQMTYVTFDFYHESGSHTLSLIDFADGAGYAANNVTIWLDFSPSGSLVNYDFGLAKDTGVRYSLNEWHQLRLEVNFATKKYNLYLDGALVGVNLGFQIPFNSQFREIQFYNNYNPLPSNWYLDNVRVEEGTTDCPVLSPADLNGDCRVNVIDLSKMAGQWLECNVDPQYLCY